MEKPHFTERWVFFRRRRKRSRAEGKEQMCCSFCNKDQSDVKKLIAGPAVYICDECIDVCNDIIRHDERFGRLADEVGAYEPPPPARDATTMVVTCTLCGMRLPWEEATAVPDRGVLCPGCVVAIEAAIAEKREGST